MESEDLDTRSFYKQTFALLPTVSKRNLKGISLAEPASRSKGSKLRTDAPPLKTADKFAMNCWNAFNRFSRPFSATGGREERGMPFEYLNSAVHFVHNNIPDQQVFRAADKLMWTPHELISFEEFRRFCWQLFQESLSIPPASIIPLDPQSPQPSPGKPSIDSFDKLSRRQHYISTTSIQNRSSQPIMSTNSSIFSKSSSAGGLSTVEKDAICEVVKRENREKRYKNGMWC